MTGSTVMIGGVSLTVASGMFGVYLLGLTPAPSLNIRERTGFYLLGVCMIGFVAGIIIAIIGGVHG